MACCSRSLNLLQSRADNHEECKFYGTLSMRVRTGSVLQLTRDQLHLMTCFKLFQFVFRPRYLLFGLALRPAAGDDGVVPLVRFSRCRPGSQGSALKLLQCVDLREPEARFDNLLLLSFWHRCLPFLLIFCPLALLDCNQDAALF